VGVEIKERRVSAEEFAGMEEFVFEYLQASVEREEEGGRMRWYPWHSAEYRYNHIRNVVDIAAEIARKEGADVDVTRVAAIFHDVAKLDAEQDAHADEGARVAREYLETHCDYPESFVDAVVRCVEEHSYQGPLEDLTLETQCLIEADLLDKVGANGAVLMMLRMGYESRTHMDAAEMVERVIERGHEADERIVSDAAEGVLHRRIKRVRWLREWLTEEMANVESRTGLEDDPAER